MPFALETGRHALTAWGIPMQFDFLELNWRFAPFHKCHAAVVEQALRLAHQVIVLVGSACKPRTVRNPWTAAERETMIRAAFAADSARLLIRPLRDHTYNPSLWVRDVQRLVAEVSAAVPGARIGLIGHYTGTSTDYPAMFPQWPAVSCEPVAGVSAAALCEHLFTAAAGQDLPIEAAVPQAVCPLVAGLRESPHFAQLLREHQYIRNYRQGWATAPYEPNFVTVDAVILHWGHVLLIRRRAEPGKGLWAFPGGFVDPNERLQAAVIRELREETGLELPAQVLLGSIRSQHVFDDPQRSLRGRTFTHAFCFELRSGELPPVRGSDDAEHAQWLPLNTAMAMEEQFFEDHFHILEYFLGRG